MPTAPPISVIVCSYNSRQRIDRSLRSLRRQDLAEPSEVIVVDSGRDGAHEYVRAAYPEVTVVRSERRLFPGPARNAGVRAAHGEVVAFLPDDGVAAPDWLRRRLERHRQGYLAVGGAIANGTPSSAIGTAGYLIEYAALVPSAPVLWQQALPHCLSYHRSLFDRFGLFPEGAETGEDTLFNRRLVAAGVPIALDPEIVLAHVNPTGMRAYLRHQFEHGRGMAQCAVLYELEGPVGPSGQSPARAAWRLLVRYPFRRWMAAGRRLRIGRGAWLRRYLTLTPLVWAGIWSAGFGAWREVLVLRRSAARGPLAVDAVTSRPGANGRA
ncbi:MAG TPA: glycosyltransferase family 2 protein [Actinomycetota bacterium]|nr:glycosyltransferase family 2 protein [Actinomycetota bacterium]